MTTANLTAAREAGIIVMIAVVLALMFFTGLGIAILTHGYLPG